MNLKKVIFAIIAILALVLSIVPAALAVTDSQRDAYYNTYVRSSDNGKTTFVARDSQVRNNYLVSETSFSRAGYGGDYATPIKSTYTRSDYGSVTHDNSYGDLSVNRKTRAHARYVNDYDVGYVRYEDSYGSATSSYKQYNKVVTDGYGSTRSSKNGIYQTHVYDRNSYNTARPATDLSTRNYVSNGYGSSYSTDYDYMPIVKNGYGSGSVRSDLAYLPYVKVGYTTYGDPADRYDDYDDWYKYYPESYYGAPLIYSRGIYDGKYETYRVQTGADGPGDSLYKTTVYEKRYIPYQFDSYPLN